MHREAHYDKITGDWVPEEFDKFGGYPANKKVNQEFLAIPGDPASALTHPVYSTVDIGNGHFFLGFAPSENHMMLPSSTYYRVHGISPSIEQVEKDTQPYHDHFIRSVGLSDSQWERSPHYYDSPEVGERETYAPDNESGDHQPTYAARYTSPIKDKNGNTIAYRWSYTFNPGVVFSHAFRKELTKDQAKQYILAVHKQLFDMNAKNQRTAHYDRVTGEWQPSEWSKADPIVSLESVYYYPPRRQITYQQRREYKQKGIMPGPCEPSIEDSPVILPNGDRFVGKVSDFTNDTTAPCQYSEYNIYGISPTLEEANKKHMEYAKIHHKNFGDMDETCNDMKLDTISTDPGYSVGAHGVDFASDQYFLPHNTDMCQTNHRAHSQDKPWLGTSTFFSALPAEDKDGNIFGYKWHIHFGDNRDFVNGSELMPSVLKGEYSNEALTRFAKHKIEVAHRIFHDETEKMMKNQRRAKVYVTARRADGSMYTKVSDRMSPEEVGPGFAGMDPTIETVGADIDNQPREVSETIPSSNSFFTHDTLASKREPIVHDGIEYRVGYSKRFDPWLEDGLGMVKAFDGYKEVGGLVWNYFEEPPVVHDMSVDEDYRRRGIGSKMFDVAKAHQSDLQHSNTLTDDGRAFKEGYERNKSNERYAHYDRITGDWKPEQWEVFEDWHHMYPPSSRYKVPVEDEIKYESSCEPHPELKTVNIGRGHLFNANIDNSVKDSPDVLFSIYGKAASLEEADKESSRYHQYLPKLIGQVRSNQTPTSDNPVWETNFYHSPIYDKNGKQIGVSWRNDVPMYRNDEFSLDQLYHHIESIHKGLHDFNNPTTKVANYNKFTGEWEPSEWSHGYVDTHDKSLYYPPLTFHTLEEENLSKQENPDIWKNAELNYPSPSQHNASIGKGHLFRACLRPKANVSYQVFGASKSIEEAHEQADQYLNHYLDKFGIDRSYLYEHNDTGTEGENGNLENPGNAIMRDYHSTKRDDYPWSEHLTYRSICPVADAGGKVFGYRWLQYHFIPADRYGNVDTQQKMMNAKKDIESVHRELCDMNGLRPRTANYDRVTGQWQPSEWQDDSDPRITRIPNFRHAYYPPLRGDMDRGNEEKVKKAYNLNYPDPSQSTANIGIGQQMQASCWSEPNPFGHIGEYSIHGASPTYEAARNEIMKYWRYHQNAFNIPNEHVEIREYGDSPDSHIAFFSVNKDLHGRAIGHPGNWEYYSGAYIHENYNKAGELVSHSWKIENNIPSDGYDVTQDNFKVVDDVKKDIELVHKDLYDMNTGKRHLGHRTAHYNKITSEWVPEEWSRDQITDSYGYTANYYPKHFIRENGEKDQRKVSIGKHQQFKATVIEPNEHNTKSCWYDISGVAPTIDDAIQDSQLHRVNFVDSTRLHNLVMHVDDYVNDRHRRIQWGDSDYADPNIELNIHTQFDKYGNVLGYRWKQSHILGTGWKLLPGDDVYGDDTEDEFIKNMSVSDMKRFVEKAHKEAHDTNARQQKSSYKLAEVEDMNYEGVGSLFGQGMGPQDAASNITDVEEGPRAPQHGLENQSMALQGRSPLPDLTSWYTASADIHDERYDEDDDDDSGDDSEYDYDDDRDDWDY